MAGAIERTAPGSAGNEAVGRPDPDDGPDDGSGLDGTLASSPILAWLRLVGIMGWTFWLLLLNCRSALSRQGVAPSVCMAWHRKTLSISGVKVTAVGKPVTDRPSLMVSNHASYLDIIALGALLPCAFVSKAEVRDWPILGWLSRLQRTVFVERNPRKAADHLAALSAPLASGRCLVVFPEGTSTHGTTVLPFKSSLFQAAAIEQVEIQPVSIAYSRLDGMPMGRALRSCFSWYGDMELIPHMMGWLGIGTLGIDVIFHPPVRLADFGNRKALAAYAHQAASYGLETALKGDPKPYELPSNA